MELKAVFRKDLPAFTVDVDLYLDSQQPVLGLMGPSGSGKTTVLKCLAGLIKIDAGRIEMNGRVWADTAAGLSLSPQKRECGLLFPNFALFGNMDAAENIRCGLGRLHLTAAEEEKEIAALLRRFKLAGYEKRYPKNLSWGEKQRLALARLMASRPQLILLDEPFGGLDDELRKEVSGELELLLRESGALAVIVSHRRDDLAPLCQRTVRMDKGKLEEVPCR